VLPAGRIMRVHRIFPLKRDSQVASLDTCSAGTDNLTATD